MNCDYTDPGGAPLERIAQQQAGTHPAPCARSCEANAYQIELRRYQAEVEQFRADARRFRLAEKNLFDVQEDAKIIAKQAIAAEAERDALAAKLKDAEHDRDEFRRVMNGFAEKMAELEGQDPVAWIYDWQAPEGLIRDWSTNNAAEIPEGATNIRPLFARQVPAEPVNARLLEALSALLDDIEALIGESAGVYGLHLNGDASPWSELEEGGRFERLSSMSRAREAIAAAGAAHTEPVNAQLLAALKVCRHKFAQYVAHHISKGDMHKAMANESMVAMADVAIMGAEAAPRVARLTAPDIVDALRGNGLYEDSRAFQRLFPILEADARAIELAVLRKNGLLRED